MSIENVNFEGIDGLGKGEASSLAIYKKKKRSAIITDDRKFLSVLEEQNIPFISPQKQGRVCTGDCFFGEDFHRKGGKEVYLLA